MKWYNKDRLQMINLDSVDGFVFIPAKEFIDQNPDSEDIGDFKSNGDRIELIIGGTPYIFRGETAREIYNLLVGSGQTEEKQLLKG